MQPENTAPAEVSQAPQPPQTSRQPIKTKTFPRQRHYLAVFFLSFMWGTFGVDRMYLGKWGTGILKLVTAGGFGLWVIVDIILIISGAMRDKQGRPMLQFEEYKKFTYWLILIFALALGVIMLVFGTIIIIGVMEFITGMQNGTMNIPGLDLLLNGGASGIPPELQEYL